VDGLEPSGPFQENIGQFVTARQLSGHPVTISVRNSTASSYTSSLATAPQQTPLGPSGSIRRGTSKRLTPSSIPFFRRSSTQSVHVDTLRSPSPPASPGPSHLQSGRYCIPSGPRPSTPPGGHKKTSIMSLASLLKGSASRRSLQTGMDEPGDREIRWARETDGGKSDKERAKTEKDRSESRISVLMGRKRPKVRQAHSKLS
jgi:dual specificity tyrosine-phosphorylation-regulated kinase 2/3/4